MLRTEEAKNTDFLAETSQYIDNVSEHTFASGGVSLSGYLGNLKVSITDRSIKISEGSLCKYYLGDNFQTMTRGDTKRAIEQMSDALHLPLALADVTRIDIAQNFIMQHPPEHYYLHLGNLNKYSRLEQSHSVYYQNSKRQLLFYNKVREQKTKRLPIPELYRGKNVLRFEMRYRNKLRSEFGLERVTAADLYDESFYMGIVDKWAGAYKAIKKINILQIDFSKMRTKRELLLMSLADLVHRSGGELLFCQQIKQAQQQGKLTPKQAHDHREAVKEACNYKPIAHQSELITELDGKISDAVKHYR